MGCEYVNAGGIRAIVCGRGHGRKRCKACGSPTADRQCDWKVPGKKSGTCDVHLCSKCSTQPAPDKDLCPTHAKAWEQMKATRAQAAACHKAAPGGEVPPGRTTSRATNGDEGEAAQKQT